MTIKNIFSKTWLRAQYEIFKYARSFRRMTDEQVNACVAHEKGLRAGAHSAVTTSQLFVKSAKDVDLPTSSRR